MKHMTIKECITSLSALFSSIEKRGGTPYLVGGCVRDHILGEESKDIDIEVHGMDQESLEQALLEVGGEVDLVGRSFGIYKLRLEEFHSVFPTMEALDISLPREEEKIGKGHTAFQVRLDGDMGLERAAARRDFTLNSMYMDRHGVIYDPFGGRKDLSKGLLRHTSSAFVEDPLRVLRAFSLSSRFNLGLAKETVDLCRSLRGEYESLSKERVWTEWTKWATKGVVPSRGLEVLKEVEWLEFFPQLYYLMGVPQDSEWHPEGDVWVHTLHVCDAMADIVRREGILGEDRLILVMAALCHDLAKPSTTKEEEGRIRSRGHEEAGYEPTRELFQHMGYVLPKKGNGPLLDRVLPLVTNHLAHCSLGSNPSSKGVRRLSARLEPSTIEELALLVEADHSGRPPLPKGLPSGMEKILSMSRKLGVGRAKPPRILTGKDLIERGIPPGKELGILLARAYEAQLDGVFDSIEGGLEFLDL